MVTKKKLLKMKHFAYYGAIQKEDGGFKGPVPEDFTLNTPVGIAQDKFNNVWVCDTGNNRIVIFDKELKIIHHIMNSPGTGGTKTQKTPFLMPFHLCPHPEKNLMFLTDMGNARIIVFSYDKKKVSFAYSFGYKDDAINKNSFDPLEDPNGVTLIKEADGKFYVYVCDEFFHTKKDIRNRCVKFTEKGEFVEQFKTIVDSEGKTHDLVWPQGISSDDQGKIFIANTGSYEILQCDCHGASDKNYNKFHKGRVLLHSFGNPKGIGSFNIMRSVNAINGLVFAADQVLNTICVYQANGKIKTVIAGILPGWNHEPATLCSITDFAYYNIENQELLNPYTICGGETKKIYYITEPFTSRVLKIEIPTLNEKIVETKLLNTVGSRRDVAKQGGQISQLNCVTCVVGMEDMGREKPQGPDKTDLPIWARYNPFQLWYSKYSELVANQYQITYDAFFKNMVDKQVEKVKTLKLTLDAGNWTIKAYSEQQDKFNESPHALEGYYIPGDLAMALHYPQKILLGQICPKTPILFVTNFSLATVTMYQLGMDGKLVNYGLPFGLPGKFNGCLMGPQGIAVSDDGEIFIADSLNNRISKWQLLNTGQVLFDSNFCWEDKKLKDYYFTPTDIAIDNHNRLFVTDQFNDRIRVFDRQGKKLWSYGKTGYCDDLQTEYERFMLPTSLCIDNDELIINDLVNRALKIFKIKESGLQYLGGTKAFKERPENGGIWMPFFIYAHDRKVYVPDSTFNVVNIYEY
ncbi:MAG: hypothetical protein GY710_01225 [Desulfobacteraceae bacterium]|nr:hypothetical protein [Desulfobacteraceae bacterium]